VFGADRFCPISPHLLTPLSHANASLRNGVRPRLATEERKSAKAQCRIKPVLANSRESMSWRRFRWKDGFHFFCPGKGGGQRLEMKRIFNREWTRTCNRGNEVRGKRQPDSTSNPMNRDLEIEHPTRNVQRRSAEPTPLGAGAVRPVRTRMNIDRNACSGPVRYR